jgi:hypothetical protein
LPISIEKTLLDRGMHTSWASVRELLRTHQVSTVMLPVQGGGEVRIRTASVPEPAHRDVYEKLGIAPEVIRRRSWVER